MDSPAESEAPMHSTERIGIDRAMQVEKIRREMMVIAVAIELQDDYETRIRKNKKFKAFTTVSVCNCHPDLRDKLCMIKATKKPRIVEIACEIAARAGPIAARQRIRAETFKDAHKRYGMIARQRLDQRQ